MREPLSCQPAIGEAPAISAEVRVATALKGVPREQLDGKVRALLEAYPDDGLLWKACAEALGYERRWLRAAGVFGGAAARLGNSVEMLRAQALCLMEGGHRRRAREIMGQIFKKRPNDALSARVLGLSELRRGSPQAAAILLDRAAELDPKQASVWCALGKAYATMGRSAAATAAFARARALEPGNSEVAIEAARLARGLGDLFSADLALDVYSNADKGAEKNASWCVERGMQAISRKQMDEARSFLQRALSLEPDNVSAHLGMALLLFHTGQWQDAWREYLWRHRLPGLPRPHPGLSEWRGEPLNGAPLFVRAEQGIGDILQFSRYLPLLVERGATVLLAGVPATLRPLLGGMPGVTLYEKGPVEAAFQVSLLDVPMWLGIVGPVAAPGVLSVPAVPGLPTRRNSFRRVGVTWAGNPRHANDAQRSCGVDRFVRLAAQTGVEFFGFQTGEAGAALERMGGGAVIAPLHQRLRDFSTTAACLRDIDLLVTVDTAIAHLAGAMGVPVWLLVPYQPDWRWGWTGETTGWYPSVRLFRQESHGDWDGVFARLETALATWVGEVEPVSPGESNGSSGIYAELRRKLQGGDAVPAETRRATMAFLAAHPDCHEAWADLGVALRRLEMPEAAVSCYRRAIAYGGLSSGVLVNMGNALNDLGRAAEAMDAHRRAIAIEPKSAIAWHGLSIAQRLDGDLQGNLVSLCEGLALGPHSGVEWDYCNALLAMGDYREGWAQYRRRWRQPDAGAIPYDRPEWDGGDFSGKRLLVFAEQGFGDTILAARFLPALKQRGGEVIVCCQPELLRLIGRLGVASRLVAKGTPFEDYDLQVAMMDLPGFFLSSPADVPAQPYLAADPALRETFANVFEPAGDTLKVGIVWSGSVTFKGNRMRAASLNDFLPLAGMPGVALYSLQKGPPHEQLKQAGVGAMITDLSPLLTDFDATAAVIEHLDLILMTDSSVAHLAGALGKPVWNLLGPRAYWLWELDSCTSPWYPTMRFFRRSLSRDWASVMEDVRSALEEVCGDRTLLAAR